MLKRFPSSISCTDNICIIFTNPNIKSAEGEPLVKIGMCEDDKLRERIKSLSRSSGVPGKFKCEYAIKVRGKGKERAIEKALHDGLAHCRESEAKARRKGSNEFFKIEVEEAKALLRIADLMGGKDVTASANPADQKRTDEPLEGRKGRFKFSMVDIKPGDKLQFKRDSEVQCQVVNDRRVEFRGNVMSLAAATKLALKDTGRNWSSARWSDHWLWKGVTLQELRLQREA